MHNSEDFFEMFFRRQGNGANAPFITAYLIDCDAKLIGHLRLRPAEPVAGLAKFCWSHPRLCTHAGCYAANGRWSQRLAYGLMVPKLCRS